MDEVQRRKRQCLVTAIITTLRAVQTVMTSELDDEEEYAAEYAPKKAVRIDNYVENVIPGFSNKQFRHFRITRESFENLVPIVHEQMSPSLGKPRIPLEKQLLSVLWILATPDSYRSVSDRFDLSKSSLSECFFRIVKILSEMAKRIICWPTENEIPTVKRKFKAIAGIDNVLGTIDGTFIVIKQPAVDGEVYKTRKCNFAITLQAICDADLIFRDCFVGYPGSVSDTRIFRNSGFYKTTLENPRKYFSDDAMFIVGDKAYPLLEWCIPPYIERGNLNALQRNCNYKISQTRQVIERAFALLFGRFRRLKFLDMNRTDFIPATVMACCVLHNICLRNETDFNEYVMDGIGNVDGNIDAEFQEEHERNMDELTRRGSMKRDLLPQTLNM